MGVWDPHYKGKVLTDTDVAAAVNTQRMFPNRRYQRAQAQLALIGIKVAHTRIARTEPEGVSMWWPSITTRALSLLLFQWSPSVLCIVGIVGHN